jgi:hypothetical protein
MDYGNLGTISATPTTFVYKGVRFAFSPDKGLTFKSGQTSVRMKLGPRPNPWLRVYLNGEDIGTFSTDREVAYVEVIPKLRQIIAFGTEAWAAEDIKRTAKRVATRQKTVNDL